MGHALSTALLALCAVAAAPSTGAAEKSPLSPDPGNRHQGSGGQVASTDCRRSVSASATGLTGTATGMATLNWAIAVGRRYGDGYGNWENARDRQVRCDSEGSAEGNTGYTFSGETCTVSARPCRKRRTAE